MEKILEYSKTHHTVEPGKALRMSDALSVGDGGSQGDLIIQVVKHGSVPAGFRIVDNPTDQDKQLVPGNTTGSRHYLESLDTCVILRPAKWNHDAPYDEYDGPLLHCKEDTTITHPTHGDVTIPGGMCVSLHYQRVYDEELKRERRQLD